MQTAITTKDNPYDPFTDYDEWYAYDEFVLKYHTCSLLARLAYTSDSLSDLDNDLAIEEAIDTIIDQDPYGIYVKVTRS